MIEVREYLDRNGRSPYAAWFNDLDATAAAKVASAVTRMSLGKDALARWQDYKQRKKNQEK